MSAVEELNQRLVGFEQRVASAVREEVKLQAAVESNFALTLADSQNRLAMESQIKSQHEKTKELKVEIVEMQMKLSRVIEESSRLGWTKDAVEERSKSLKNAGKESSEKRQSEIEASRKHSAALQDLKRDETVYSGLISFMRAVQANSVREKGE